PFLSSTIEGERKQVTIIFADISGFTALNDAARTPDEVERVLQIVNHCLHMLSEVVYEYDGYIDKYIGDAIMAVFGAPRSHEDDPERALRAALAMRSRLETFNRNPPFPLAEPLGIHLGINTGTVIAGLIGTKRKRAYTVMGDAVNVASRLEGVSERGEILVSQDTYHLTNRLFIFKERGPVEVKGKREPLVVYELLGARSRYTTQRGIAGLRAPMVGRKKQFATLKRQIADLQKGKGGITVVVGEAGLGKSRLISELQQQTSRQQADLLWLEGRGLSYRQNQSYKLLIEILRQYLGVSPDEPGEVVWQKWQAVGGDLFGHRQEEVIPYLAMLMGVKLPEEATRNMPLSDSLLLQHRMFVAVGEWVEAVAPQKPLVLVFEDLHWADPNSVAVLRFLMTMPQRLPLRLICITRPEKETDFWPVKEEAAREYPDVYTEFVLHPLTEAQSRSLVDLLLQVEQLPDTLERLILSRSEGNPLFMEEVLRSLIEDGTLVKEDDTWTMTRPVTEIDIPETLTGVLTARIDRLDEPVKRTLQIAAVIGRVFSYTVLTGVTGDITDDKQELNDYLATLVAAELIRERTADADGDREFIFKHVLTHETAYNTLLLQQRRAYHKRIADYMAPMYYLKGEEYASIIAHHYEQGEVWHRALTYLIRAAEASTTTFDNINAVHFYNRALNIARLVEDLKPPTLIQIYEGRGNVYKRLGKMDEAQADFEKTLQLAKEGHNLPAQMRALGELGKLLTSREKFSQAAPYFEEALRIARQTGDKKGLVDALNQLGHFKFNIGRLTEAHRSFQEALDIARPLKNTRLIGTSQDGLANVLLYQGEISGAIDRLEQMTRTWRDIGYYQGLMEAYIGLAAAYHMQAKYDRSDQICADALDIQERTGDLNWAAGLHYYQGQNAFARGNLPAAQTHFAEAVSVARRLDNGIWQSVALTGDSHNHRLTGYAELALSQAQEAVQLAEKAGSPLWAARAHCALGVALCGVGDTAQAETLLQDALNRMTELGFVPDQVDMLAHLLDVFLQTGNWDKIPPLLQRLTGMSLASDMQAHYARARLFAAHLAEHQQQLAQAADLVAQAQQIAQSTGNRLLEIAATLHLARLHIRRQQTGAARTAWKQAGQQLQKIAALLDDDVQTHFLQHSPLAKLWQEIQTLL
ncbi:MAG: hypothetical protein D6796_12005, partial [Caldilineae bacterium]